MTTWRVLVSADLTDEAMQILHDATDVDLHDITPRTRTIQAEIPEGHALIARDDVVIDRGLLERAPELRVIGRIGADLDGIDIDAATERGVLITNTPGTSAVAAGEHAILLMLALARRLTVVHNSMREGWWLLDRKQQMGTQLAEKTLGLVGLGRVGRVVAGRAAAFGMTVLAYDPYIAEEQVSDLRVTLVGLKELLNRSDYVSLHIPATRETHGLFDEARVAQMKPGAHLINTASGHVWDEMAVAEALKDRRLAGVAVDVYPEEPPYTSPLVGMEHVIHTPHIGDNTKEAAGDLSRQIVLQVLDALRGVDYRNAVNMPFVPGMAFEQLRPYLALGERIGKVQQALTRSPIRTVAVECTGDDMQDMIKPLTVAILKGILTPVLSESVSYINAPVLAAERGIRVMQAKGLRSVSYTNLLTCQVIWEDDTEIVISGTLLGEFEPHIVLIDQYPMNFIPQGHMLIMGSKDTPGVIGRIGTLLADNEVNIASWHTGRAAPGGNTLTVLALDQPVPPPVMEALLQQDFVRHATQLQL